MTATFPLLSAIIFWPLIGAALTLAASRTPRLGRWVSLGAAALELCLVLSLYALVVDQAPVRGWLLVEDAPWIVRFGIRYSLGLDGISLALISLTALLGAIGVLVSWPQVKERPAPFYAMLLFSQTTVMGVFLATDLFLFTLFWELQLIPTLFLIGIWGHERRGPAALKFFLYNMGGSLLMLVALISLYLASGKASGVYSFALSHLCWTVLSPELTMLLFVAFLLAMAIKIPLFPLHGWLPDAHTEAPTAGSIILAGLLLKTGVYALIRIAIPLFPGPAQKLLPLLLCLGLIAIGYGSLVSLRQRDMKRLVAYSSIGHLGLIVAGIAVLDRLTLSGAILQMVNHGLTTSALFIMVGMLDERFRTRALSEYGGIWGSMPCFGGFFLLFGLASLGLPGLNNFVGEILILVGLFRAQPLLGGVAATTMVLTLLYMLQLLEGTLFGPAPEGRVAVDLDAREITILATLALLVVGLGLFPQPFLNLIQDPVQRLLDQTGIPALAWRL